MIPMERILTLLMMKMIILNDDSENNIDRNSDGNEDSDGDGESNDDDNDDQPSLIPFP